jgi:phosphoglycolate phosphatase-like HAD superfamily hydrolase
MKVVFDLDGVLRDLNGYLMKLRGGEYPTKWDFSYNGKSIYECINEDLSILYKAPPTGYLSIALSHHPSPEIWTSQPKEWRDHTMSWIREHIGKEYEVHFLKCEEKEDRLYRDEDHILIEDSPNFRCYDRILLIDRPYNQDVKAVRVFGPRHLDNLLENIKEV